MHALFEYIPLVIFFVVNKFVDIYWATASLIASSALQILYYIIKKEKVPTRNWIFFGLIAVFGGLTIFLHDEAFIKWKVTIINEFFAIALLVSYYLFKKNIIKQFLSESINLPDPIWTKLNLAWALFFALCGVLNWYVAFNFDLETWVNFKVFGLTGLMFAFSIITILSLHKYMRDDSEDITNAIEDSIEINSNVISKPQHNKDNDKI
ncbi:septation protein A [Colwellia sp. 6_MG-2023]|jgi:intracellular septation protein|uniref:septation protein A n=1 Tax=Colwellia sp. 6_MG-2023 TaxID=3062676 RepID=UPI0026E3D6BF|nr:septation protein A [Colwellia sp. 6_MG-2023]MDO6487454.1 septation protein A [Colwellia sp. 6_MG-2023]